MRKFRYSFLALMLVMAILISPTVMFSSFAADGEITKEWVMLGDADLNGIVTIGDARIVLRIASRIDPAVDISSKDFKASDVDKDKKITIMDARKILRHAVDIELIESEPNPLLQPKPQAEIVEKINTFANSVKINATTLNERIPFKITDSLKVSSTSVKKDLHWLDALLGSIISATLDPMLAELKNDMNYSSVFTVHSTFQPISFYNRFPVGGQTWSMKLDEVEKAGGIKSSTYEYDPVKKQATYMVVLKNETITASQATNILSTNHGKIFTASDASVLGALEDENGNSLGELTMTYSDCYVKYVFDLEAEKPLSAEYFSKCNYAVKMDLNSRSSLTMNIVIESLQEFDFNIPYID